MAFKPALIVVDMQNDFCSPQGLTPVSGNGMDLVAPIKQLLSLPGFAMRVTTFSDIPENHKAMAHNHTDAKPLETYVESANPKKGMSHKTVKQLALHKCCIQGTWGAQLVDGLQESDFDLVVRRNANADTWM